MGSFAIQSAYIARTQLPVARVKKICKIDPDCSIISAEAVQLLTLATERFVGILARAAYGQTMLDKRKTLQLKDLEFCVKNYELFNFLDGALDGWPESKASKKETSGEQKQRLNPAVVENLSSSEVKLENILDTDKMDEEGEEIEYEDLNAEVDELDDEVFGFDESLEGTIPTNSPFDRQVREREMAMTVHSNGVEDMDIDNAVTDQALKPETFGHYGYHFPSAVSHTISKI